MFAAHCLYACINFIFRSNCPCKLWLEDIQVFCFGAADSDVGLEMNGDNTCNSKSDFIACFLFFSLGQF